MSEDRTPSANITPFGLRMQPDLKRRVEDAARASNRSLNSEIVARLEESLDSAVRAGDRTTEIQGIMIESLSRENEALKKAGIATENLLLTLAGAINRAATGDDTELKAIVEREKTDPTFRRMKTVWSVIRED